MQLNLQLRCQINNFRATSYTQKLHTPPNTQTRAQIFCTTNTGVNCVDINIQTKHSFSSYCIETVHACIAEKVHQNAASAKKLHHSQATRCAIFTRLTKRLTEKGSNDQNTAGQQAHTAQRARTKQQTTQYKSPCNNDSRKNVLHKDDPIMSVPNNAGQREERERERGRENEIEKERSQKATAETL